MEIKQKNGFCFKVDQKKNLMFSVIAASENKKATINFYDKDGVLLMVLREDDKFYQNGFIITDTYIIGKNINDSLRR